MPSKCLIALGANLPSSAGEPQLTLRKSLAEISRKGCVIQAISRFFSTPCFPVGSGPDYVNAAAVVETRLDSRAVMELLHDVEALFGRERQERWGKRCLDLDLLALDGLIVPEAAVFQAWHDLPLSQQVEAVPDQLILPHPRLQDRAFVLVPLMDVAAAWRHPILDKTVAQMFASLSPDAKSGIEPL